MILVVKYFLVINWKICLPVAVYVALFLICIWIDDLIQKRKRAKETAQEALEAEKLVKHLQSLFGKQGKVLYIPRGMSATDIKKLTNQKNGRS